MEENVEISEKVINQKGHADYSKEQKLLFVYYIIIKLFNTEKSCRIAERKAQK
jgi:hypothetical protein